MDTDIKDGEPSEAYHADGRHIGSSGLKLFARSPLHYWAEYLDPEREPRDTKAFRIGRAWHCAVFEPGEFGRRYAASHDAHPSTKRAALLRDLLWHGERAEALAAATLVELPEGLPPTSKEGKALIASIEAEGKIAVTPEDFGWIGEWLPRLAGRDVLPADVLAGVQRMAAVARALPISAVVFGRPGGRAETSIRCTDRASGVLLKIRPDYALEPCAEFPDGLIIDGKSTTDAGDGFARQVWNLDYGLQAALYTRVFREAYRTRGRPAFVWLAQEKERPYAAAYYGAGADLLAYWDRRIDALLPAVRRCQETNTWPGYPTTVSDLQLPAWAERQVQERAA